MASIVVSSHYISDGNDLLDLPMGGGGCPLPVGGSPQVRVKMIAVFLPIWTILIELIYDYCIYFRWNEEFGSNYSV